MKVEELKKRRKIISIQEADSRACKCKSKHSTPWFTSYTFIHHLYLYVMNTKEGAKRSLVHSDQMAVAQELGPADNCIDEHDVNYFTPSTINQQIHLYNLHLKHFKNT